MILALELPSIICVLIYLLYELTSVICSDFLLLCARESEFEYSLPKYAYFLVSAFQTFIAVY